MERKQQVGDCWVGLYSFHIVNRGFEGYPKPHFMGSGAAPRKNFGFGPYFRLGGPTYGFVHDFRTCFLDVMVFGPWYWVDGFLVHGIGCDGFSVHGIGCFGMYKYVL